jgi:prophage maintenance system killer protein
MKDPYNIEKIIETQKNILLFSTLKEDNKMAGFVLNYGTLYHIVTVGSNIDDHFKKAAWYLFSIANYAPFLQGNKRTARRIATEVLIIGKPRYELVLNDESITQFITKIGNPDCSFFEVESWLGKNIREIE